MVVLYLSVTYIESETKLKLQINGSDTKEEESTEEEKKSTTKIHDREAAGMCYDNVDGCRF